MDRIKATGQVNIIEGYLAGARPALHLNNGIAPFTDIRVRQALNYAMDKDTIIKTVELGNAVPQYGPISLSVLGYWKGVEDIGYKYDPEKAKALLKEAGYTPGPDGILQKDGPPLKMEIEVGLLGDYLVKVTHILQEEYKAVGIAVDIRTMEIGLWVSECATGKCQLALSGFDWSEADILAMVYHSSAFGSLNIAQVNDPELDKLLEATRTTMDASKRQQAVDDVQKYIVEKTFIAPIYTPMIFNAVTKRIIGALYSPITSNLYLGDAYIK